MERRVGRMSLINIAIITAGLLGFPWMVSRPVLADSGNPPAGGVVLCDDRIFLGEQPPPNPCYCSKLCAPKLGVPGHRVYVYKGSCDPCDPNSGEAVSPAVPVSQPQPQSSWLDLEPGFFVATPTVPEATATLAPTVVNLIESTATPTVELPKKEVSSETICLGAGVGAVILVVLGLVGAMLKGVIRTT